DEYELCVVGTDCVISSPLLSSPLLSSYLPLPSPLLSPLSSPLSPLLSLTPPIFSPLSFPFFFSSPCVSPPSLLPLFPVSLHNVSRLCLPPATLLFTQLQKPYTQCVRVCVCVCMCVCV